MNLLKPAPQTSARPLTRVTGPTARLALLLLLLAGCNSDARVGDDPPPYDAPQLVGLEIAAPTRSELIFSSVKGGRTPAQRVTLKNVGDAPLRLSEFNVGGADASAFALAAPTLPLTLEPQGSVSAAVTFAPTAAGAQSARLHIIGDVGEISVSLYGLGSEGEGGENEPSLQSIADTLGYTLDVGDPALLGIGDAAVGDEMLAPLFKKAGDGPVTLTVVARYGPEAPLPYGTFTLQETRPVRRELGLVAPGDAQELLPPLTEGSTAFDPGAQPFGVYARAETEERYSLDGLNEGALTHALRVYPLRDRGGNALPGDYLIGFEEAQNGDYQDAVFVLTNVEPVNTPPTDTQALGEWEPLFNGHDLDGWYTYLPSEGRGRDPEGVFRAENGVLHILGVENSGYRDFGYLATERSYENYHLRLEYRWGEARFPPREDDKRDSGVIYHVAGSDKVWPRGVEYQIQEGDTGDFWMLGGTTLTTTVETSRAQEPRYKRLGESYKSRAGDYVRIIKDGTFDSRGDWNTVDIIVRGDTATHMINGQVNNRAYGLFGTDGDALSRGKILLQAEGAEIFYRNIEIRSLK